MNSQLQIEPPGNLLEKIMKRIHHEERVLIWRKVILFSATLAASVIGFIPAFRMVSADFAQSGFFNFFSLIFSDFSSVAVYWRSFTLMLLETLPAISLAVFLAVVLTLLQSARSLTRNVKTIIYAK